MPGQGVRASWPSAYLIIRVEQRRTFLGRFWNKKDDGKRFKPKNALSDEFVKKQRESQDVAQGSLAKSSIFEEERASDTKYDTTKSTTEPVLRNAQAVRAALDPRPIQRMRWQRKMVIRHVKKRGRLTKAQTLKKQEREFTLRSHDFKTSVKKMVPLAKQIAGKTLDDAITQMRFSKKLVAKEIRDHLIDARNQAITRRGMGLGKRLDPEVNKFEPRTIITKDKKFIKVADPTTIYVDQAWCGKGTWDAAPDYRARGRAYTLRKRNTSK